MVWLQMHPISWSNWPCNVISTAHLWPVWQIIQSRFQSEEASVDSQWRKEVRLYHLQQVIRPSQKSEDTVERKDNCSGCDKSLAWAENLKTHMLIHTGEKPHKCNSCNKLFTQAGDLRQHTMTHTGEKPPKKNRGSAPFHSAPEMEILFVCLSQDFLWYTPITIKMVYLLNVSLCSPKMLSEIMRWKGFLPQCGVVEFSNDSLIACLNRRKVTLVAIVWNSSPFVFSHVSSNCLLGRMQSSTGCMCLTFHRDVFLNAFSNCLPQKMHSHTGCICGIPLCVSNVSSNGLRWWNANRPSLRKI